MMKLFVLTTALLFGTIVWAADAYEEVSYDDLVRQISQKKSSLSEAALSSSLDNLAIHAGLGLITSENNLNINGNEDWKAQNGFQLSMGIDLFSDSLMAEAVLRNFGQSTAGLEVRSLREYDLKMLFQNKIANRSSFFIGGGLASRMFKFSDPGRNLDISDTTPAILASAGISAGINRNVSVGFELGWRTALVTNTIDKNSADATLRIDTAF